MPNSKLNCFTTSNLATDLEFALQNNLNVLLVGKHGVGKTSTVLDVFEKNKINYLYFSAPTMDPWVDFVGVPKEKQDDNGKSYLDLVRPKAFQDDSVEAIFLDEYNRSPKKVRNAVMELIQFKSINGKKFNNLKVIWAAVNPSEEDDTNYDIEEIDPAQLDRFEIQLYIPYKPCVKYFAKKYNGSLAQRSIKWWSSLNENEKNLISPRRLDYILNIYNKKGNIRLVMPKNINARNLYNILETGSIEEKLESLNKNCNDKEIKSFFNDINNISESIQIINDKMEYIKFLDYIPKEFLVKSLCKTVNIQSKTRSTYSPKRKDIKYKNIFNHIEKNVNDYYELLISIQNAKGCNNTIQKKIKNILKRHGLLDNTSEYYSKDTKDIIENDPSKSDPLSWKKAYKFISNVKDGKSKTFHTDFKKDSFLKRKYLNNVSKYINKSNKSELDVDSAIYILKEMFDVINNIYISSLPSNNRISLCKSLNTLFSYLRNKKDDKFILDFYVSLTKREISSYLGKNFIIQKK